MFFPNKSFQGSEHLPFYNKDGDAVALLVHGFPGTPAEMRPLASALQARGWSVQGILLPGFGPEIEMIVEKQETDWVNAVLEPLAALRLQYRVVMVIGYSLGGALAVQAATYTAPDGMVLLAPFWQIDHILWKSMPVLRRLFNGVQPFRIFRPNFADPNVRAGILNFMPGTDLDDPQVQQAIRTFRLPLSLFEQIYRVGQSARRLAPALPGAMPILVLQGADDDLVRPHVTRRWISKFPMPVDYHEVPGKHDLPTPESAGWPSVLEAVTRFADRLQGGVLPEK